MKLSDEVVSYILNRAPRSAPPLMQLLERLDQASLSRSRPITIPLLAELRLWSTDQ
ncbi:MAG: HdaA/DnaA family protein [Luminiphilus sp.]